MFISPIRAQAGGALNLHLGCGEVNHERFINIDAYAYPHVHYAQDIANLGNFTDESVDLIYASHCLEHFEYLKTESILAEWHRVLKYGGILRLSVPDFDKLLEIYNNHGCDPETILPPLMGGQNNKYNYHLTVLNSVNLNRMLGKVGFKSMNYWQPGSSDLTTFNDFSVCKMNCEGISYEISLNVEAIK